MQFFPSFIETADQHIVLAINGAHTPWLDCFLWMVTSPWPWIPLYILAIGLLLQCYRRQRSWRAAGQVILFIVLAVALSDLIASGIIKPLVMRPRPTHTAVLEDALHLHRYADGSVYRGGAYGFVSSHAATTTTIAILFFYFIKPFFQRRYLIATGCTLYVLLICYTRIYLGAHFLLDILGGMLTGIMVCLPVIFHYHKMVNTTAPHFLYFCNFKKST